MAAAGAGERTLTPDEERVLQHASPSSAHRVILHVDLDCFYCQVEINRLGLDPALPMCVQQWNSVIAVNYAARAAGISRIASVDDCKRLCPGVKLVHVETIGKEGVTDQPSGRAKVTLERYRVASTKIMAVFESLVGKSHLERASIDEAYLDVTHMVEARIRSRGDGDGDGDPEDQSGAAERPNKTRLDVPAVVARHKDWVVVGGKLRNESAMDRRLVHGAIVAAEVRAEVFRKLRYTCSAGVAHNKTLAKLGSAMNKPNRQTLFPVSAVQEFMCKLPLRKIKMLGGKLGKSIDMETAGEMQALPLATLRTRFGDKTGTWLFRVVRGIDEDPVVVRPLPKSMGAHKSFTATASYAVVRDFLIILANEIETRVVNDEAENNRRPQTITLHVRSRRGTSSKSSAFPSAKTQPAILAAAESLFEQFTDPYPVSHLGLNAHNFVGLPSASDQAITSFFTPGNANPAPKPTSTAAAVRHDAGGSGAKAGKATGVHGSDASASHAPLLGLFAKQRRGSTPTKHATGSPSNVGAGPGDSSPGRRVCPICNGRLPKGNAAMNAHIDRCVGGGTAAGTKGGATSGGTGAPAIASMFAAQHRRMLQSSGGTGANATDGVGGRTSGSSVGDGRKRALPSSRVAHQGTKAKQRRTLTPWAAAKAARLRKK